LRGQRIELGDIEATLAAHPSVREAVVLCRDDGGDPRLVAYLVPRAGASCEPPALRAFLEERLPEHMVPALFVELESLPLNPNGKADRKALGRLPLPGGEGRREGAFAAPRDVLELRLARIWEEVLGVASVGVRDDFFALGGHSLSAVRLLARIEQEQGRQLPLAAFFRAPTVEQLARLLRQHESPSAASLVAIRTGGTRAPLFCVHPAGGNVLSFVALADALGPDQPLYALQSRGLEGGEEPLTRVEEMAARYLAEVRAAVPHGPYNLAGWSFGGLVAFEMARQLRRQGEEVALLALLDTRAPGTGEGPAEDVFDDDAFWLADVAGFLSRLAGRESAVTYEELRQAAPAAQVGLFVTRLQEIDFLPPGAGEDQVRRLLRVYKANVRAAAAYEGGPYPGRVTVLRAAAEERQDEALGWQRFSPEPVEVHDVPGDHVTVLARDNVPALAQRLGDCL
ncbi:MAG TPA: alpha/beta fold hydrolase, partial [Thermoanaerobaculia bacterium]